ncbi:unnamed protein product [Scytosiphon promiscuus]
MAHLGRRQLARRAPFTDRSNFASSWKLRVLQPAWSLPRLARIRLQLNSVVRRLTPHDYFSSAGQQKGSMATTYSSAISFSEKGTRCGEDASRRSQEREVQHILAFDLSSVATWRSWQSGQRNR